jgi:hypothetical protein
MSEDTLFGLWDVRNALRQRNVPFESVLADKKNS